MRFARSLASLVIVSSLAVGCSSEEPNDEGRVEVNPAAELAPRDVSDSAIVEDGKITLPRTQANIAWSAKLREGTVIAGNLDTTHDIEASRNKSGFLRKVVRVQEGERIDIETTPAALDELVQGNIVFGRAAPSIFRDAPASSRNSATGAPSTALRPLDEGPDKQGEGAGKGETKSGSLPSKSSTTAEFSQEISNITFGIESQADGEIAIKRGRWVPIPTGINKARAKLSVTPNFGFDLLVKGKFTQEREIASASVKLLEVTFTAGTIPVTLELAPKISCKVSGGVDVSLSGKVKTSAGIAVGFEYTPGSFNRIFEPQLNADYESKNFSVRALTEIKCEAGLTAKLKAFDSVGIEGFLGLEYKLTGSTCGAAGQDGVKLEASRRTIGYAKAVIEVPVIDITLTEKPLFEVGLGPEPKIKATLVDKCGCKPGSPPAGEAPELYCDAPPLTQ